MEPLTHAPLFAGINGFGIAADRLGWEQPFHCEIDPFCQRVIQYYWPNSKPYYDIRETDFTIWRGKIDVLSGGFPCQPFSTAGKRKGTEDERHLWPEMLRAIREIAPTWVVGENVRGLINWSGGLVFEQVQADLEAEGYEVLPFLLPACGVNAPHRRDRVWFIAYSESEQSERVQLKQRKVSEPEQREFRGINSKDGSGPSSNSANTGFKSVQRIRAIPTDQFKVTTNPERLRQQGSGRSKQSMYSETNSQRQASWSYDDGGWPTQSPIRLRNDGFSRVLVRYLTKELTHEISNTSEENRIKNLHEVWGGVQSKEIWEEIRGLYSLESKEVLFQTMQLYSTRSRTQNELSPFSQNFSEKILRTLQKHGEFRRTPQGRKLQKQREEEYPNLMSQLPHEVALAARRFETELLKFDAWHRSESLKGFGNAIIPELALQIFKTIQQMEGGE